MGIKKDYTFWCAKNSTEFDPTELEKKLYDLVVYKRGADSGVEKPNLLRQ